MSKPTKNLTVLFSKFDRNGFWVVSSINCQPLSSPLAQISVKVQKLRFRCVVLVLAGEMIVSQWTFDIMRSGTFLRER